MDKSEYLSMYQLETSFWWYRVLHELVESTVGKFKPQKDLQLFDAGCGTGRMVEICQKYGKISGIDFSADAVDLAKKRGLSNIEVGDLNNYRFESDFYDAILSLDVLYHTGINDDLAVLSKFYQALKNDGILVINLPAFEYLRRSHDVAVHTRKRYRKNSFTKDLEALGFTILNSTYRMPHLYLIILISKLFKRESGLKTSGSDLKVIPVWLNSLLFFLGRIENRWIRLGFRIPVGSSLFVVAKKTG